MPRVDVLIPTYGRKTGLAVVLACLLNQEFSDFDVIISDQSESEETYLESRELRTLVSALRWRGHRVALHRHLPRRGMAEHRNFLLEESSSPYVHFVDDDVVLERDVIKRMYEVIASQNCGFVGCPATGLEYLGDYRPHQQGIELWQGDVRPEDFIPGNTAHQRHLVNNAANPLHLEQSLVCDRQPILYKVSWVGGANVLYDREKLLQVGGFSWWERLPPEHAGEEVVAQWLLIRRFGGCGILPSGTYHLGLPTTLDDRTRNATELFGELIREQEGQEFTEVETVKREERNAVLVGPQDRHEK